jgi:hypothetical protein
MCPADAEGALVLAPRDARPASHGARRAASRPFKAREHKRIAVKVIDFRRNEVAGVVNPSSSKYEERPGG